MPLERFLFARETQARLGAFCVGDFEGPVWWPAGRNHSGPLRGNELATETTLIPQRIESAPYLD